MINILIYILLLFFVCLFLFVFVLWRYLRSIYSYLHATSTPIGLGVGPPVEAVVGKGSAAQVQDETRG